MLSENRLGSLKAELDRVTLGKGRTMHSSVPSWSTS